MGALVSHTRDQPWRPPGEPFAALARAVIGQQISVKAAASVWERLRAASGAAENGLPTPEQLRRLELSELRGCGLSQRKAEYVHALAEHFLAPGFSEAALVAKDDDAIIAELIGIRGIGRWTAEMFLMFHLHRPDVLPVGDLGLRVGAGLLYGDGGEMRPAEVTRLAVPWRPYASAATWLLWRFTEADSEARQRIRAHLLA